MADAVDTRNRREEETAGEEKQGFFRAHPRAKWILLVVIILIVAGVAFAWMYFSGRESTDDAQIDGHISPISARVGGTVVSLDVRDNQFVEAGTVLVQIDPRDYKVALERAQADLATAIAAAQGARTGVPISTTGTASRTSSAGAQLNEAVAGINAAEKGVDAAQAQHTAAQARLREAQAAQAKAERDVERYKQLVAKNEISRQQYDAAVTAAEASRATTDAAKAAVAQAEQGVAVAQSHVAQAQARRAQADAAVHAARSGPEEVAASRAQANASQARVDMARAVVAQAELNLQYTTVKAPVSGVVSRRTVEVGAVVQPGQPLLAIIPLEDIWVTANFKETQLRYMRVGQRATIKVDAYGGHEYHGRVDSIAAATGARFSLLPPENATGNFVKVVQRVPVKIVLDKGQGQEHILRPGMSVEATVFTK